MKKIKNIVTKIEKFMQTKEPFVSISLFLSSTTNYLQGQEDLFYLTMLFVRTNFT